MIAFGRKALLAAWIAFAAFPAHAQTALTSASDDTDVYEYVPPRVSDFVGPQLDSLVNEFEAMVERIRRLEAQVQALEADQREMRGWANDHILRSHRNQ